MEFDFSLTHYMCNLKLLIMKKFKKLLALSFCLVALTALISSCSKDDDNNNGGPYDVEFKVTTTGNAQIMNIIHSNASGDQVALSSVGGTTWSSKVTVQAGVPAVSINATSYSETGATITAQILVNGKVVKEVEGRGTALVASTTYVFGTN